MKFITSIFVLLILVIGCEQNTTKLNNKETKLKASEYDVISENTSDIDDSFFAEIVFKDSLIITFKKHDSLSISFQREHKDSAWSSISFGRWPFKAFDYTDTINLSTYIMQIDSCWNYVSKLGSINIKSLSLLAPQHYPDILKNQIKAFSTDELWREDTIHTRVDDNKTFNFFAKKWSENIMLKNDIYKPINDFLKQKGFKISWYALEKLIEIPESKQKEFGIDSVLLVPSALAINVSVSKFIDEIGARLPAPDSSSYDPEYYYSMFDYVWDNFKVTGQKIATKKVFWGDNIDEHEYVDINDDNPEAEECAFQTVYNKDIIYEENNCDVGLESQSILFVNYSFEEVMRIMKILKPREFYNYSNERRLYEGWRYTGDNAAEYVMQVDCWLTVKGIDSIRVEFACAFCAA